MHQINDAVSSGPISEVRLDSIQTTILVFRLEILNLVSLCHRRFESQLLLFYSLISDAPYVPKLNYRGIFSKSQRLPMSLIYCHLSGFDFFASTTSLWNFITANVLHILPPSKFETLLNTFPTCL